MKLSVFWFRRDFRLEDNTALHHALNSGLPVMPIFIFDRNILDELPEDDARVNFIYNTLFSLNNQLLAMGSSINIYYGDPFRIWEKLIKKYEIENLYVNRDYELYALERDSRIKNLLDKHNIGFHEFKDQVIFEKNEVRKADGKPYTVFTPYKRKWLQQFNPGRSEPLKSTRHERFYPCNNPFPMLSDIGFRESRIRVRDYDLSHIDHYAVTRDLPGKDSTTYLGSHLRFGTVSVRKVIRQLKPEDDLFLSELIWREFFMQIMFHFPNVVTENFNPKFNDITWRNDEKEFDLWCQGKTGYPLVDAGMRQLNSTGYMHNRVRMVTASFLCKHLLIDWRWGEAWFAKKLLDYELSSNNGNWQWAAGTGCDAAPYFRVFNPETQQKKFDRDLQYIKRWIPEFGTTDYPDPMIDHQFARERALQTYRKKRET